MKDVLMNKPGPVTKSLQLLSLLDVSSVKRIGIGMSVVFICSLVKNLQTQ